MVEKLTGLRGLSSDNPSSFTTAMRSYRSSDGRLDIVDTPGNNVRTEAFDHMLHVAYALSYKPVTRVLLVVAANATVDSMIETLHVTLARFMDTPLDLGLFGVCVTMMDHVSNHAAWRAHFEERYYEQVATQLGLNHPSVIYSSASTAGAHLCDEVLHLCHGREPTEIQMDAKTFLQCFQITNTNFKIAITVRGEIARFKKQKDLFLRQLSSLTDRRPMCQLADKIQDLVFSFNAHMMEEIPRAQRRVAEEHNMLLEVGPQLASEAGHLANLSNCLKGELYEIRTMMMQYQKESGISDVRKCPHCGCLWCNFDSCDGETTCGNHGTVGDGEKEVRTFTFLFDGDVLEICPGTRRSVWSEPPDLSRSGAGCGRRIVWRDMQSIAIPPDFRVEGRANTQDVMPIPIPEFQTFEAFYNVKLAEFRHDLVVSWPEQEHGMKKSQGQQPRQLCAEQCQEALLEPEDLGAAVHPVTEVDASRMLEIELRVDELVDVLDLGSGVQLTVSKSTHKTILGERLSFQALEVMEPWRPLMDDVQPCSAFLELRPHRHPFKTPVVLSFPHDTDGHSHGETFAVWVLEDPDSQWQMQKCTVDKTRVYVSMGSFCQAVLGRSAAGRDTYGGDLWSFMRSRGNLHDTWDALAQLVPVDCDVCQGEARENRKQWNQEGWVCCDVAAPTKLRLFHLPREAKGEVLLMSEEKEETLISSREQCHCIFGINFGRQALVRYEVWVPDLKGHRIRQSFLDFAPQSVHPETLVVCRGEEPDPQPTFDPLLHPRGEEQAHAQMEETIHHLLRLPLSPSLRAIIQGLDPTELPTFLAKAGQLDMQQTLPLVRSLVNPSTEEVKRQLLASMPEFLMLSLHREPDRIPLKNSEQLANEEFLALLQEVGARAGRPPECVFFNTCGGQHLPEKVVEVIPCVIYWQLSDQGLGVPDQVAKFLAKLFAEDLAACRTQRGVERYYLAFLQAQARLREVRIEGVKPISQRAWAKRLEFLRSKRHGTAALGSRDPQVHPQASATEGGSSSSNFSPAPRTAPLAEEESGRSTGVSSP